MRCVSILVRSLVHQTVLWPAGSTIVVGMIYIAEGAIRGNALHCNLGTWLMLVAAATLFTPGADSSALYVPKTVSVQVKRHGDTRG
jgi:hypothetical protein